MPDARKDDYLYFRLERRDRELIRRAARLDGSTVSQLVREAAVRAAAGRIAQGTPPTREPVATP